MNDASIELCRELYELSGWDDTGKRYRESAHLTKDRVPAYDLGYLLRKLPETDPSNERFILTLSPKWVISYEQKTEGYVDYGETHFLCDAYTPEDVACKLAIELFKQGILSRT